MTGKRVWAGFAFLLLTAAGCDRPDGEARYAERKAIQGPAMDRVRAAMDAVAPLYQPLQEPMFGDWESVYKEPGQTFDQYLRSKPRLPTPERRTIYVQPLGEFTAGQNQIVALTADYMGRFFNLPVEIQPAVGLTDLPEEARRTKPWGEQVQTGYLMGRFLRPDLPKDAAARIGFITRDLFPNEKMNFVFGQASLRNRVGVWSLFNLGEPDKGGWDFRLCLLRTIKIAAHETAHMFSLPHCTKYECVMNGSNSVAETDRSSVELCPECMAKVCWATDTEPAERYRKLAVFWRAQGLVELAEFFEKAEGAARSGSPAVARAVPR